MAVRSPPIESGADDVGDGEAAVRACPIKCVIACRAGAFLLDRFAPCTICRYFLSGRPDGRNVFMMTPAESDRHDLFLRLYVEHEEALNGFVRTLVPTREAAREVMQEVAVVVWRRFEELSDTKDFRRWAFGVAKFKALAFMRDQMRDRLVFDADVMELLAAEVATGAEALDAEREALDECLGKLGAAQRKLLDAAYAPGVRMDELAVSLGRSPAAFYQTIHRIRLTLLDCTQRVLKRRETV